jgi:hypothetical protein
MEVNESRAGFDLGAFDVNDVGRVVVGGFGVIDLGDATAGSGEAESAGRRISKALRVRDSLREASGCGHPGNAI